MQQGPISSAKKKTIRIMVDEYDQLRSMKKEEETICQHCEQQVPLRLIVFCSLFRPSIKMFVQSLKKTNISWNAAPLIWQIFKNLNVHNEVSAERKNAQLIKCIKVFASSKHPSTKRLIKNPTFFSPKQPEYMQSKELPAQ